MVMKECLKGLFIGKTYELRGNRLLYEHFEYCVRVGTVDYFNDLYLITTDGKLFKIDEDFDFVRWPECVV